MVRELIYVICIAVVFISLLGLIRGQMVFLLKTRLLHEESLWLGLHIDQIGEGHDLFERYRRLPSYTAMTLKFWKTMGSFEREAGSIEQYYPFLKVRANL